MLSIILANKIFGLMIILLIGVVLVKLGIVTTEESSVISRVTIYAVTPCAIITSYQVSFTAEVRSGLLFCLALSALIELFFILANGVLKKILKLDEVEQTAIIYSNSLNLIIPLVSAMFGPEWVVYTSMYSSLQTVMLWSHAKSVLSGEPKIDLMKVIKNNNIIAVMAGLVVMALGITSFPDPVQSAMNSLSVMVGPMGMLTMGMLIGSVNLKEIFANKKVLKTSFLRLVVMPLPVVLILKFVPVPAFVANVDILMVIVLLAAIGPTAVLISQLSQICGKDAQYASAIGVVSTLLCIITMPLLIALYQL